MKKIIYYILCATFMVQASLFAYSRVDQYGWDHRPVENFHLCAYQMEIAAFPYQRNVGKIEDAKSAKSQARILWKERFSAIDPDTLRRIEVLYDEQAQCWLVRGTLPESAVGGVPNALISRDGSVLAVWHTM